MFMYFAFDFCLLALVLAASPSSASSMKSYSSLVPSPSRWRSSSASSASVEDDLKWRKKSSKAAVCMLVCAYDASIALHTLLLFVVDDELVGKERHCAVCRALECAALFNWPGLFVNMKC